jgi:hypothetical protein
MAKIRAIVNGVSYYTSTTALKKQTSSCHTMQNAALYQALAIMGKNLGVATTVVLYDGKMHRYSFDVQLCVVGG